MEVARKWRMRIFEWLLLWRQRLSPYVPLIMTSFGRDTSPTTPILMMACTRSLRFAASHFTVSSKFGSGECGRELASWRSHFVPQPPLPRENPRSSYFHPCYLHSMCSFNLKLVGSRSKPEMAPKKTEHCAPARTRESVCLQNSSKPPTKRNLKELLGLVLPGCSYEC